MSALANSGLMQRSKDRYSIISSARAIRVGGTAMPIVLD